MIQIYDSLQGKKVPFHKEPGDRVSMYVCGPTVYDHAHLGHGRSAVAFDVIRRFLEFSGYEVDFAFNTTDIDDKMINRAKEEGISVPDLAAKIIPEYSADYAALGVKEPTYNPRATDYIEQMIGLIKQLEEKGYTYVLEDGVYFDITKFEEYGKLSHQKLDELNAGSRVEERKDKRNHQDFVLWKFKKEGEPVWPAPWGEGRPGWHIECSAMSQTLLGETLDIHGGGLDLKFPHHECEIAQSESASGKAFAKIWMHNGYITIDKEKMSKSLGNFFTLKEIFERYNPRVVRFFLLSTHYRSPIEYSDASLEQAANTLRKIDIFCGLNPHEDGKIDQAVVNEFKNRMADDFDAAGALSTLFKWINNKPNKPKKTLKEINKILNVFNFQHVFDIPTGITKLKDEREQARKEKNYEKADRLRKEIEGEGFEIIDLKEFTAIIPKQEEVQ